LIHLNNNQGFALFAGVQKFIEAVTINGMQKKAEAKCDGLTKYNLF